MTEARAISDGRAQLVADLVAAKALIDTPEKWWKGSYHNDAGDCFCAMGAVLHVTDCNPFSSRVRACRELLEAAVPIMTRQPVGLYNDEFSTTHADIMALFDRAIKEASNG